MFTILITHTLDEQSAVRKTLQVEVSAKTASAAMDRALSKTPKAIADNIVKVSAWRRTRQGLVLVEEYA